MNRFDRFAFFFDFFPPFSVQMGKTLLVENAGDLIPLYLVSVSFHSRFSVVYFVF